VKTSPSSTAKLPLKSNKFNILWTPEVHRRLHNNPQIFTNISQINLKYAPPSVYFRPKLLLFCSHLCLCLSSSLFPSRPRPHSVLSYTLHTPRFSVTSRYITN